MKRDLSSVSRTRFSVSVWSYTGGLMPEGVSPFNFRLRYFTGAVELVGPWGRVYDWRNGKLPRGTCQSLRGDITARGVCVCSGGRSSNAT